MSTLCAVCETEFEARRSTAKYCSAKCRQRAKRGTRVGDVSGGEPAVGLVDAVQRQLTEAGRLDTVDGQAALVLARQATAAGATGVSALIKEMRQVLSAALAGVPKPGAGSNVVTEDRVEQARKAREQKARQAARRT